MTKNQCEAVDSAVSRNIPSHARGVFENSNYGVSETDYVNAPIVASSLASKGNSRRFCELFSKVTTPKTGTPSAILREFRRNIRNINELQSHSNWLLKSGVTLDAVGLNQAPGNIPKAEVCSRPISPSNSKGLAFFSVDCRWSSEMESLHQVSSYPFVGRTEDRLEIPQINDISSSSILETLGPRASSESVISSLSSILASCKILREADCLKNSSESSDTLPESRLNVYFFSLGASPESLISALFSVLCETVECGTPSSAVLRTNSPVTSAKAPPSGCIIFILICEIFAFLCIVNAPLYGRLIWNGMREHMMAHSCCSSVLSALHLLLLLSEDFLVLATFSCECASFLSASFKRMHSIIKEYRQDLRLCLLTTISQGKEGDKDSPSGFQANKIETGCDDTAKKSQPFISSGKIKGIFSSFRVGNNHNTAASTQDLPQRDPAEAASSSQLPNILRVVSCISSSLSALDIISSFLLATQPVRDDFAEKNERERYKLTAPMNRFADWQEHWDKLVSVYPLTDLEALSSGSLGENGWSFKALVSPLVEELYDLRVCPRNKGHGASIAPISPGRVLPPCLKVSQQLSSLTLAKKTFSATRRDSQCAPLTDLVAVQTAQKKVVADAASRISSVCAFLSIGDKSANCACCAEILQSLTTLWRSQGVGLGNLYEALAENVLCTCVTDSVAKVAWNLLGTYAKHIDQVLVHKSFSSFSSSLEEAESGCRISVIHNLNSSLTLLPMANSIICDSTVDVSKKTDTRSNRAEKKQGESIARLLVDADALDEAAQPDPIILEIRRRLRPWIRSLPATPVAPCCMSASSGASVECHLASFPSYASRKVSALLPFSGNNDGIVPAVPLGAPCSCSDSELRLRILLCNNQESVPPQPHLMGNDYNPYDSYIILHHQISGALEMCAAYLRSADCLSVAQNALFCMNPLLISIQSYLCRGFMAYAVKPAESFVGGSLGASTNIFNPSRHAHSSFYHDVPILFSYDMQRRTAMWLYSLIRCWTSFVMCVGQLIDKCMPSAVLIELLIRLYLRPEGETKSVINSFSGYRICEDSGNSASGGACSSRRGSSVFSVADSVTSGRGFISALRDLGLRTFGKVRDTNDDSSQSQETGGVLAGESRLMQFHDVLPYVLEKILIDKELEALVASVTSLQQIHNMRSQCTGFVQIILKSVNYFSNSQFLRQLPKRVVPSLRSQVSPPTARVTSGNGSAGNGMPQTVQLIESDVLGTSALLLSRLVNPPIRQTGSQKRSCLRGSPFLRNAHATVPPLWANSAPFSRVACHGPMLVQWLDFFFRPETGLVERLAREPQYRDTLALSVVEAETELFRLPPKVSHYAADPFVTPYISRHFSEFVRLYYGNQWRDIDKIICRKHTEVLFHISRHKTESTLKRMFSLKIFDFFANELNLEYELKERPGKFRERYRLRHSSVSDGSSSAAAHTSPALTVSNEANLDSSDLSDCNSLNSSRVLSERSSLGSSRLLFTSISHNKLSSLIGKPPEKPSVVPKFFLESLPPPTIFREVNFAPGDDLDLDETEAVETPSAKSQQLASVNKGDTKRLDEPDHPSLVGGISPHMGDDPIDFPDVELTNRTAESDMASKTARISCHLVPEDSICGLSVLSGSHETASGSATEHDLVASSICQDANLSDCVSPRALIVPSSSCMHAPVQPRVPKKPRFVPPLLLDSLPAPTIFREVNFPPGGDVEEVMVPQLPQEPPLSIACEQIQTSADSGIVTDPSLSPTSSRSSYSQCLRLGKNRMRPPFIPPLCLDTLPAPSIFREVNFPPGGDVEVIAPLQLPPDIGFYSDVVASSLSGGADSSVSPTSSRSTYSLPPIRIKPHGRSPCILPVSLNMLPAPSISRDVNFPHGGDVEEISVLQLHCESSTGNCQKDTDNSQEFEEPTLVPVGVNPRLGDNPIDSADVLSVSTLTESSDDLDESSTTSFQLNDPLGDKNQCDRPIIFEKEDIGLRNVVSGYKQSQEADSRYRSRRGSSNEADNKLDEDSLNYYDARKSRRIYTDPELQGLTLVIILSLLLHEKRGILNTLYFDDSLTEDDKLNVPSILKQHLNHPCNRTALTYLLTHVHLLGQGGYRMLKLLLTDLFHSWPYAEVSKLGVGSHGNVLMCDVPFEQIQTVAVKQIPVTSLDRGHTLFMDTFHEICCADEFRFANPGICELLDFGVQKSEELWTYSVVMKRYHSTLHEWRKSLTSASSHLPMLLGIFGQIVSAIVTLHARGVVHYDLKCINILVDTSISLPLTFIRGFGSCDCSSSTDSVPSAQLVPPFRPDVIAHAIAEKSRSVVRGDNKDRSELQVRSLQSMPLIAVADLGESRMLADRLDIHRSRDRGTELIKSPELLQLNTTSCDPLGNSRECSGSGLPSDIWSLGCLFYELITGTLLFEKDPLFYPRLLGKETLISENAKLGLGNNQLLVDFLSFVLVLDPRKRPTAVEVLTRFEDLYRKISFGLALTTPSKLQDPDITTAADPASLASLTKFSAAQRSVSASCSAKTNQMASEQNLIRCQPFVQVLSDLYLWTLQYSPNDSLWPECASFYFLKKKRIRITHIVDFRPDGLVHGLLGTPAGVRILRMPNWSFPVTGKDVLDVEARRLREFFPILFDFLRAAILEEGVTVFLDSPPSADASNEFSTDNMYWPSGRAVAALVCIVMEGFHLDCLRAFGLINSHLVIPPLKQPFIDMLSKFYKWRVLCEWRYYESPVPLLNPGLALPLWETPITFRFSCLCGACSWRVPESILSHSRARGVVGELARFTGPSLPLSFSQRRSNIIRACMLKCNCRVAPSNASATPGCPTHGYCGHYLEHLSTFYNVSARHLDWLVLVPPSKFDGPITHEGFPEFLFATGGMSNKDLLGGCADLSCGISVNSRRYFFADDSGDHRSVKSSLHDDTSKQGKWNHRSCRLCGVVTHSIYNPPASIPKAKRNARQWPAMLAIVATYENCRQPRNSMMTQQMQESCSDGTSDSLLSRNLVLPRQRGIHSLIGSVGLSVYSAGGKPEESEVDFPSDGENESDIGRHRRTPSTSFSRNAAESENAPIPSIGSSKQTAKDISSDRFASGSTFETRPARSDDETGELDHNTTPPFRVLCRPMLPRKTLGDLVFPKQLADNAIFR